MKYVEYRLKGGIPHQQQQSSSNTSQNSQVQQQELRELRQHAKLETLEDVRTSLSTHIRTFDKWKSTERADGSFIQFYRNRHGMTALHTAAKYGDYLIVSELIHTHHFCISSVDHYGKFHSRCNVLSKSIQYIYTCGLC